VAAGLGPAAVADAPLYKAVDPGARARRERARQLAGAELLGDPRRPTVLV